MLRKIFIPVLALLVFRNGLQAQSYITQRNQVFLVNVISNAVIGGVGGAINRHDGKPWYKAFAQNFVKGGAGGLVKYLARYEVYYLNDSYNAFYAPIDRLCYFLGHSIALNSAYDRKILSRYYCNFYGIDIRYDPQAEKKLQARLSLASLEGFAEYAIKGYSFNLYKSLEYGLLLFDAKGTQLGIYDGQTRFNTVVVQARASEDVLSHELIHVYQLYDLFGISSFYDKQFSKWYSGKKWYKALSGYITIDYQVLFPTLLYAAMYKPMPDYYKNYMEFEAEHFRTRAYIKR